MKGIISILAASLLASGASVAQDCSSFHKRKCMGSDNAGMMYNTQSRSGMFVLGHTSDLVFVAHSAQDYHISLCQDKKVEEPIKFKILDGRNKEVLFDSEKAALDTPAAEGESSSAVMSWQFTAEVTKKIIVRITAPGPPPQEGGAKGKGKEEVDPKSLFCVGVLIESMPTAKLGF